MFTKLVAIAMAAALLASQPAAAQDARVAVGGAWGSVVRTPGPGGVVAVNTPWWSGVYPGGRRMLRGADATIVATGPGGAVAVDGRWGSVVRTPGGPGSVVAVNTPWWSGVYPGGRRR